jgi:hypothetical protein
VHKSVSVGLECKSRTFASPNKFVKHQIPPSMLSAQKPHRKPDRPNCFRRAKETTLGVKVDLSMAIQQGQQTIEVQAFEACMTRGTGRTLNSRAID